MLYTKLAHGRHGRRNRSRRYRSRGTNVEAKVMNFIIIDLGCVDSEIIQSVNLNMLRVREQDAACGLVLTEMNSAQLHNWLIELAYT